LLILRAIGSPRSLVAVLLIHIVVVHDGFVSNTITTVDAVVVVIASIVMCIEVIFCSFDVLLLVGILCIAGVSFVEGLPFQCMLLRY